MEIMNGMTFHRFIAFLSLDIYKKNEGGKFLTKFSAADNPIRISDFRFCASPVTSDSSSCVIDVSLGGVVNSWKNRIICLQMRLASLLQFKSVAAKVSE